MPLYEYECDACHHRFEVIQKFSDAPLTECPKCGGHLEKLLSSPAIQFKGTGWYITDYARAGKSDDGGKSSSKSESKSEGKSGSGSETKTETKTEAKTESSKSESKSETKSESKPSTPSTS